MSLDIAKRPLGDTMIPFKNHWAKRLLGHIPLFTQQNSRDTYWKLIGVDNKMKGWGPRVK